MLSYKCFQLKKTVNLLGSHSLVVPCEQYLTILISKRHFSFFTYIGKPEKQVHFGAAQSRFLGAAEKQSRKTLGQVKFLNAVRRSVTTKPKESDMIWENGITGMEMKTQSEFCPSVLKEDNLDLFWELSQGNLQNFNKLREYQMKLNILSKIFNAVPTMNSERWMLFLTNGLKGNERYLSFLIGNAIKSQNEVKNLYKLPFVEDDLDESDMHVDDPMCYHLFHNAMFIGMRPPTFKKRQIHNAMASMLHGPEVFIDCSYGEYMNFRDSKYLSRQIIAAVRSNMKKTRPLSIILCNFDPQSISGKCMTLYSPLFYESDYPVTITSESYLALYPREKFVYLTPHCNKLMKAFDPERKYIIGGYVDKSISQPASLAKAKENKIEMAKLPLDVYLDWKIGKKTLCVNHVVEILAILAETNNDWNKAFDILPERCLKMRAQTAKEKRNQSTLKQCVRTVDELGKLDFTNVNFKVYF